MLCHMDDVRRHELLLKKDSRRGVCTSTGCQAPPLADLDGQHRCMAQAQRVTAVLESTGTSMHWCCGFLLHTC